MSLIRYQKGKSFWMESSESTAYPKLASDIETDVAIIGAGIAGLTSAYLLKQAGLKVVVLEQNVVGGGTTGHTTGKVTSQHGLVYSKLYGHLGKEAAQAYGEANQAAVEEVRKIIEEEKMDCDWRAEDNYVYTEKDGQVASLKWEAEVAASLGLPATFETETPLPFGVRGAVRFRDQGTFHARKYVLGLARAVHGNGSYIFEHTKAGHVSDGNPATVRTEGGTVRAKHVILASLVPYPVSAHTAYGLVEYPLVSYIVAVRSEHDLPGMYISTGGSTYSILPVRTKEDKLLLVGGQSHIPGTGFAKSKYEKLLRFAKERLNATPTEYRWQAWDYLGYDDVPAIGRLYPWSKNFYVATGFMKWGMTNGTVSGMILRDLITGKGNPWAATFDSTRGSTVASIPRFLTKLPRMVG